MKKLKLFLKKNKYTTLVIILFLIVLVILVQVKNIFFPNMGKAIYGNRLDGIEKVEIKKASLEKIESKLKENSIVQKVSVFVKGKLLNVIVTVKEDTPKENAKELTTFILENLTEKQKKYYDLQIFLQKTNEDASFPIIGYKHHGRDQFSFTKDR